MIEETSESQYRADNEDRMTHYRQVGERLASRRKSLGLEQKDVAQRLKLPGMVINDIESGQIDRLSGLYRRGYLRNYARLLELDPDELLAAIGEDAPPALKDVLPAPRREWRFERYLKIATYVLVTTVIVPPLAYFFIAGGSRMLERDPAASPDQAPSLDSAETVLAADRSQPPAAGTERSTAEADSRSEAGHVSASALPLSPMRLGRESEAETRELASEDVAVLDENSVEALSELTELKLELVEDSWIEIHDADGERLEYDLLRDGQVRSYQGRAPFRVVLGRSSAVELQVNGQFVVWDGHDRGDMAELRVAADGGVAR
jgi:cytoskeleton protein RodZ